MPIYPFVDPDSVKRPPPPDRPERNPSRMAKLTTENLGEHNNDNENDKVEENEDADADADADAALVTSPFPLSSSPTPVEPAPKHTPVMSTAPTAGTALGSHPNTSQPRVAPRLGSLRSLPPRHEHDFHHNNNNNDSRASFTFDTQPPPPPPPPPASRPQSHYFPPHTHHPSPSPSQLQVESHLQQMADALSAARAEEAARTAGLEGTCAAHAERAAAARGLARLLAADCRVLAGAVRARRDADQRYITDAVASVLRSTLRTGGGLGGAREACRRAQREEEEAQGALLGHVRELAEILQEPGS